jgi:hypothetical protein
MKGWVWNGFGLLVGVAIFSVANWITPIATVLPREAIEILLLVLGVAMYVVRRRALLAFGIWEFLAGMYAAHIAAVNSASVNSWDPMQRNLFYLAIMASVFLIVRALGDIVEAAREIRIE